MDARVVYEHAGSVATVRMDDGKVNVLSPHMLVEVNAALDQAEADGAVVMLTGRPGMFSAGFDLGVLRGGGPAAADMLRSGFELAMRLLSFPTPVVIACPGHAIAMASFLLLSADYRIGSAGPYRITANEVVLGLTMPWAAIEICRQRLSATALPRVVALAEVFTPESAVDAGFLDRAVGEDVLVEAAKEKAEELARLNMAAHRATKLRVRQEGLEALRAAIDRDDVENRDGLLASPQ